MPAECWACAVGLTKVTQASGSPVGVCQDCGVLGCTGHGSVDRLSGLWVCHKSVVKQAGASAGVPTPGAEASPLQIDGRADLHDRFSALTRAADYLRPMVVERLDLERVIAPLEVDAEQVDLELLYDALAIAAYLTQEVHARLDDEEATDRMVLFGPLDRFLDWIRRG